ncbi:putative MATE family efflux protein [Paenibacillus rhizosphaerae]|uniref:Putative MATE family efflux protein n=1 Tax=Paenibacillus rhizosphaerae TaxID=297318 RepID=A0A839TI83_9BACL|nr:MATE family efflux transporter [Paenibacillus rhizosphaerae]MBB3126371.1 putative MATE family efflux protein [Paenibacillus rhizosphaerae]
MGIWVRERSFYSMFFRLTVLIGLQNIITLGVNLSDNLLLGGYSESALSGVALANQIQFILHMLVMGAAEGLVILSSRNWGAKNIDAIKRASSIGMRIALAVSVIMWAVVFFFPHGCLSLFTNEQNVIIEGAKYLKIICFSYIFFAVTNILLAALRSVEVVRIGFLVSLSTLIINVCLNYLLIYGHLGFPRLGVSGSAIATLSARVIECVIVLTFVKKFDQRIRFKLKDFYSIDMSLFKQYLRIGSPVLMANLLWAVSMGAQTAILGHMGEAAIAANSVANTIFQLVTVITYASASATAVIIGKTIGEGNTGKVISYSKTLQLLYLIIGVLTAVLLFAVKGVVLDLYAISESAKTLALQFMTILSVTVVGTAYQMPALTGIVRSGGDTKFVLYNDFIFMWLIVLPASALCAFVFDLSPVITFMCLKCDQILKCFVAIVKVNRYRWIRVFDERGGKSQDAGGNVAT